MIEHASLEEAIEIIRDHPGVGGSMRTAMPDVLVVQAETVRIDGEFAVIRVEDQTNFMYLEVPAHFARALVLDKDERARQRLRSVLRAAWN